MKSITGNRWQHAQQEEFQFWQNYSKNPERIFRWIYNKYLFFNEIKQKSPELVECNGENKRAVEIGIGPFSIGAISFLEPQNKWEIIGIDPLPRVIIKNVPDYLDTLINSLTNRLFNYIQMPAENINNTNYTNYFDLAICDNVLEHTLNPYKIIKNIYDLLKHNGCLILRENILSLLGFFKKEYISRKIDIMHPYHFNYYNLLSILQSNGFKDIGLMSKSKFTIFNKLNKLIWKAKTVSFICHKNAIGFKNQ